MKALVFTQYGSPAVLSFKEQEKPMPKENELLIVVYATSVNRTDIAAIKGVPFFVRVMTGWFKPKKQISGTEFAGVVEQIGSQVSGYQVGDRVFGFHDWGAQSHAEFIALPEPYLLKIPDNHSFGEMIGIEGFHYALNFVNKVNLQAGQKVLVNGGTGAIGSATVQLLKHFGAEVTAVCGVESVERVRQLGADHVIAYQQQDFTQIDQQFDVVMDTVGKSSFFKCKRILKSGGIYLSSDLGFLAQNLYLPVITAIINPSIGGKKTIFPAPFDIAASLRLMKQLVEENKFHSLIDRIYPFEEIIDAFQYVSTGKKIGNVVITVKNELRNEKYLRN